VGDYTDDNTSFTHGFVRDPFGHIKTGTLRSPARRLHPHGGQRSQRCVRGFYDDITANGYAKAFVHSPNGVTTTLLPPLAVASVAYGINPFGLSLGGTRTGTRFTDSFGFRKYAGI